MCTRNENGKYPSCVEAKYGGPGCEAMELCGECRAIEIHYKEPLYLCKYCGRHHWDEPKDCPTPTR